MKPKPKVRARKTRHTSTSSTAAAVVPPRSTPAADEAVPKNIRPGLVFYEDDGGFGLSVVIHVSKGEALMLNAAGDYYNRSLEQFSRSLVGDVLPEPGSLFDSFADYISPHLPRLADPTDGTTPAPTAATDAGAPIGAAAADPYYQVLVRVVEANAALIQAAHGHEEWIDKYNEVSGPVEDLYAQFETMTACLSQLCVQFLESKSFGELRGPRKRPPATAAERLSSELWHMAHRMETHGLHQASAEEMKGVCELLRHASEAAFRVSEKKL